MQGIILAEAEQLKKDTPKLAKLSDEYLFSLVCFKYFYNQGELSYTDYRNIFVDGKSDGGLDLVAVDSDNDVYDLLLIQSKNQDYLPNFNDIIDALRKMRTTITDFLEKRTDNYSKKLKQKLKDKLAEVEDLNPTINLVIFHNAVLTAERLEKLHSAIDKESIFESYDIHLFFRSDIEERIKSLKDPVRYADEAKIKISKKDGHIEYGENGLLVNVFASSIRDIYDRFRDRGLFEQNFRYFVKNKKIDDNIKISLSKKKDKFWFLNNGIIIGCKEFDYDNDNVKVRQFSIINGCQTATLIGEHKEQKEYRDFVIPCKFVKPAENSTDEQFEAFISEIAESSNSQKPISDRDLKANRPEQRQLQAYLKQDEPEIYLEIKRGIPKKKNIDQWQYILNDELGQLVLSFFLQQPCTARSSKKKIFADEAVYQKVFKRKYDKASIVDLLRLNEQYLIFLNKKLQDESFTDIYQENVATNGRLIILAVTGFFIKLKRDLINLKIISDDAWQDELQKDVVTGAFFSESRPDNYDEILYSFFVEIIQELADLYSRGEKTYKTVSGFFKLDKNYNQDILKHLKDKLVDNLMRKKNVDEYLKIFK